jgi:hypothetical protein
MARKVVSRKRLRDEADAAEALEKDAEKAAPKKKKGRKKATRKRAKTVEDERKRLFWGVFNHQLKRVALFDFTQKKAAEEKAEELSKGGKNLHFVQKVKEAIEE